MRRAFPLTLVSLGLLTALTFGITQPIIVRVQRSTETTSRITAQLLSVLLISAISEEDASRILKDAITAIDFPIVVTDERGRPRAWKMVGVPPTKFTPEELASPDEIKDPDYKRLLAARDRLARAHEPFPIRVGPTVVGYVYYGEPNYLAWLRYLQVALPLIALATFLGMLWAARSLYRYQTEAFWASFAKGLAHQMGTPVTSSWGWLEILKKKEVDPRILEGLERDLERMRGILRRFSKIGGKPQMTRVRLGDVVARAVEESRWRFLRKMELQVEGDGNTTIKGEPELLSWAVENFIKNAYEARDPRSPKIKIRMWGDGRWAHLEIEDNGKGIPKDKQRLLFKRSFSTKERGWGVGLLLVRRIVEEIHRGRVRLVESRPGRTVFRISLPLENR